MATTHIAGLALTVGDHYLRQRCGWCGEVLIEYDLARVAVPIGQDPTPATWEPGALVTVDGRMSHPIGGHELPDDACANNPLTTPGVN